MSRQDISQLAEDIASRKKTKVPPLRGSELDDLLFGLWLIKRAMFR